MSIFYSSGLPRRFKDFHSLLERKFKTVSDSQALLGLVTELFVPSFPLKQKKTQEAISYKKDFIEPISKDCVYSSLFLLLIKLLCTSSTNYWFTQTSALVFSLLGPQLEFVTVQSGHGPSKY